MKYSFDPGPPIIISVENFTQLFDYVMDQETLRNQLIIDLPCQMGLRPLEMVSLRWENTNIDTGQLLIQDSKNKRPYPLPFNYQIAKKLQQLKPREGSGLIIKRLAQSPYSDQLNGSPISREYMWRLWRKIAKRAGIQEWKMFTPRFGRHYFAAMWNKRRGNLEVLRRILRHKSLEYTQVYLRRLVFFKDVQAEYQRIQEIPAIHTEERPTPKPADNYRDDCRRCVHFKICRFKEDMAQLPIADCRMFETRKPDMPSIQFMKPSRKRAHRGQPYYR